MNREDFNNWLLFAKPNWKEISWQYETGRGFQHRQDLKAVFWNSYIYFQQKFEDYFKEFNKIPLDIFNELIFEFRQHFPKAGRLEGINYFDDLIEQLIEKTDKKVKPAVFLYSEIDPEYFESPEVLRYIKIFERGMTATVSKEGYKAKVYTAELWKVLSNTALPLIQSKETLNGQSFISCYVDSFKKGVEYFKAEFALSPNVLYTNPQLYVDNLHVCYFHKEPIKRKTGWIKWETSYPLVISEKAISEYGFYAGVLFEFYEVKEKHSALFKNFDTCQEFQNQLKELKTEKIINTDNPKTFAELFNNEDYAEPCLNILRELQPPVIDALNNYIGTNKGVFPLWVKVLKTAKQPLIKHYKDEIYKDLLNQKIKGLNLSKDASEFRKTYQRLINNNTELDIKALVSQLSQSGILGK